MEPKTEFARSRVPTVPCYSVAGKSVPLFIETIDVMKKDYFNGDLLDMRINERKYYINNDHKDKYKCRYKIG